MTGLPLFEDANLTVYRRAGHPLLVAVRRATKPTPVELRATTAALAAALSHLERARFGMLVDLRLAPLRNEPEMAEPLTLLRAQLITGFAAVARLVSTSVGMLQGSRLDREEGVQTRSFLEESAAFEWLQGELAAQRKARK